MSTPAGKAATAHMPGASWLGNALALLALLALAAVAGLMQPGPWWVGWPVMDRIVGAAAALLLYIGTCAAFAWRLRARGAHGAALSMGRDTLLVVHASQTGFATLLAQRTADTLAGAGMAVQLRGIGTVDAALLARHDRALFVLSTTGEGDAPDVAVAFARDAPDLSRLQYGVLALGDRTYSHFCGFGHRIDHWLQQRGARALFDIVEVDNGDAGALRHWQHQLARLADAPDLPDWQQPGYARWRLARRTWVNPGSPGAPCHVIALQPIDAPMPGWHAGDIAEVGPRHAAATVDAWLLASRHDGQAMVSVDGAPTTLATLLARCALPPAQAAHALHAQALADSLRPLPHREYSIASLPADGALELLVRRMQRGDGNVGLGSGWLTEGAAIGAAIDVRIRSNPGFHAPGDERPMILIGNGTGLAGLRALLKARIAAGHARNWLLFGERSPLHDRPWQDELSAWQAQGALRCDLAFSRDAGRPRYVQQLVAEQADTLRAWIADGAAIHVCGSLDGMAPGVDAELVRLIGREALDAMLVDGRYRRDVY